jgi:REP-associated tyrosine transposase
MPRANRHYIPGYVWHITRRCHKKEFVLKFARDRRRYLQWVFGARKRYGLSVLNYTVTPNHVMKSKVPHNCAIWKPKTIYLTTKPPF